MAASRASDYTTILTTAGAAVTALYGLADVVVAGVPQLLAIARGRNAGNTADALVLARFARQGAAATVGSTALGLEFIGFPFVFGTPVPPVSGVQITTVQFPGLFTLDGVPCTLVLVCIGAREGIYPKGAVLGMSAYGYDPATTTVHVYDMASLDALGTGQYGATFPTGTSAKELYFRGIVGYNNHIFGWGFDSADATNGDGPARVMFSNPGDPRKWGNDNIAAAGNRAFTDSDAIVLGSAGEMIRGACVWDGKLYFGTNQQLHYVAGYGRDSFLTDGATAVADSYNIVGPHALIEGPDRLLYGVSDRGLWAFDGRTFRTHFRKLVDYAGHSPGYWDCIWTDPTRADGYPGRTNQDLVWMAVDLDREQVIVGIPFCDATLGAGPGNDTVVLKFHTATGGFTRQVYLGSAFTAAGYYRREGQQREVRLLGSSTAGQATIQRYAYQAAATDSPAMPTILPDVEFGPYAIFGPDGIGSLPKLYLTLAWEAAASLPIVFTVTVTGDGAAIDSFTLTIAAVAPVAPVANDVWVDTSLTDANLGNATAGATIAARPTYLTKRYVRGAWQTVPGSVGRGTRATIPLALKRTAASRVSVRFTCTSAAGRMQIEGLGSSPGGGKHDA